MKNILFLIGTGRKDRMTKKVFDFIIGVAKSRNDIQVTVVDVIDFPQTHTEGLSPELNTKWSEIIKSVNGMIIISPEYNHGYPGELKMLLDSAYDEYKSKPVAICGVSNGPVGGARMAEQLKLVLSAFQMMIINLAVYFSNVDKLFDEGGNINDREFWIKKVNFVIDEVLKY